MAGTESTEPLVQSFVWIIAVVSLSFVGLRLYIKWRYRRTFGYDDYALVVSVLLLMANAGVIQTILGLGYGQHVKDIMAKDPGNIRKILIYLMAASGIIRLSTNIARVSFAMTLLRLANEKEKIFVWFAITSLLAVMTPAIILPFATCSPFEKIFDQSIPGTCIDKRASIGYFYFQGAYTASIDFALVFLPWRILSNLQMRRVEKIGTSLAMSLGILSGAVTIMKVAHTSQIRDPDWTYSSASLTIWNMVEPSAVIIAATLPNLRVFIVKSTANLKASFRLGSNTHLGAWKKGQYASQKPESDTIRLAQIEEATKAIPASGGTEPTPIVGAPWMRGDDDSEKSILREARGLPPSGIVQTITFAVEHRDGENPASSRERWLP